MSRFWATHAEYGRGRFVREAERVGYRYVATYDHHHLH